MKEVQRNPVNRCFGSCPEVPKSSGKPKVLPLTEQQKEEEVKRILFALAEERKVKRQKEVLKALLKKAVKLRRTKILKKVLAKKIPEKERDLARESAERLITEQQGEESKRKKRAKKEIEGLRQQHRSKSLVDLLLLIKRQHPFWLAAAVEEVDGQRSRNELSEKDIAWFKAFKDSLKEERQE